MTAKLAYIWDYDIDEEKFKDILSGKLVIGHLDKKWAIVRLFEYAPYKEIIRLMGYKRIVEEWPGVRNYIRSKSRKRGFDFLVEWIRDKHPEKIQENIFTTDLKPLSILVFFKLKQNEG